MTQAAPISFTVRAKVISQILISVVVIALIFLYVIFLQMQDINAFFESEFLHINFLKDLSQHHLTAKGFFTTYGEHLFPGYNLVLAIDYYLFRLRTGIDSIVFAICLISVSLLIISAIFKLENCSYFVKTALSGSAALIMLSTTHNPQWGMALAASIGVVMLVVCIDLISQSFEKSARLSVAFYLILPVSIIFFLGGYSLGAAITILLMLLNRVRETRQIDGNVLGALICILACLLLYSALVIEFSDTPLFQNRPTNASFDARIIGKFILIMGGASVLGESFFQASKNIQIYYFCGGLLFFWSIFVYKDFFKSPNKTGTLFVGLATYSLINILTVSLFRFKNGPDGAMGQWYNIHTQFLSISVLFYLFTSLNFKKNKLIQFGKLGSILIILSFVCLGFYSDWKKAPYIIGFKSRFVNQAPIVLAFPDMLGDKSDSYNTMLWKYPAVKTGVDFLYENSLWIFDTKSPLLFGITEDNWLEAGKDAFIVCPVGAKKLSFLLWRPEGWRQSKIIGRFDNISKEFDVNNSEIQIQFSANKPVVQLLAGDMITSNPVSSVADSRRLVTTVTKIRCEGLPQYPVRMN